MYLENRFMKVVLLYLQKYSQIKIHINQNGKITKTETKLNSTWILNRNLRKILNKIQQIETKKAIVITLKQ